MLTSAAEAAKELALLTGGSQAERQRLAEVFAPLRFVSALNPDAADHQKVWALGYDLMSGTLVEFMEM